MFKRTSLISMIAFASLLNPGYTLADETTQEITLIQHICNRYLSSKFTPDPVIPVQEQSTNQEGILTKLKKNLDPELKTLSAREAQEIAFCIVSSNSKFETSAVDSSCLDKLEIIGGAENAKNDVFSKLFGDSLSTMIGHAHAALTICHPITDVTTLRNRQSAIEYLNNHQLYSDKMSSALQNIAALEEKSLTPWTSKNLVKLEKLNESYFSKVLNIGGWANTSTLPLELFAKKYPLLLMGTFQLTVVPASIAFVVHQTNKLDNIGYWNTIKAMGTGVVEFMQDPTVPTGFKIGAAAYSAVAIGGNLFGAYTSHLTLKSYADLHNHLQTSLIATASHVKELKKLSSLVNQNRELLTYLPSLQPLANFKNQAKHSAQLNKLLGMLDTDTFTEQASLWSITGRILAAHELMKQVKDELAPAFAAAGELDMYIALAKLYNSREGKLARYCMVNFVDNSTTPMIDAHNFWNPFINPDTVVVNNATFGSSCPNSILTGPNTGGKSTVIKAIMLNTLMAQTFGIAPSESLTLTPFTQLNCFMNISDDIATGASLFKSEVMRAKKLLDIVQSLKPHEFSFVIIDEIFTGTSPKEGEIAAMRFATHLGTYKNNVSIIATHYPRMVDLETETNGNYRNHHVEILRNEDDSLNRTFKLKNGPSFFNVASDILEEEGLFI